VLTLSHAARARAVFSQGAWGVLISTELETRGFPTGHASVQDFELVITMARGLILCLLHALAVASALVITPAVRAVRLAPRAACPTMDGDGPMVGKCKWFK